LLRNRLLLAGFVSLSAFSLTGCGIFGGSGGGTEVITISAPSTVDGGDTAVLVGTLTQGGSADPAGVTWSSSVAGTLSNTSTGSATFTAPAATAAAQSVVITATSGDNGNNTQTATITVPAKPAVTTGALPAGTVGAPYSLSLAGSGGITPYTWTLVSGTLPSGLTMNAAGVISGTPLAAGVGTVNLQFKLTDSGVNTPAEGAATPAPLTATSAMLGLTINPALSITTGGALPAGYGGAPYTQTLAATGGSGSGYTWSVTAGASSLTAVGLSLTSGGGFSGTALAGSASFTAQVMDSLGNTASQAFTLTINPGVTITSAAALKTGYATVAYSQTLTATGGSGSGYTWSITSGAASLTALGLNLSGGGVVSGTPTAGSASFTVKVTDSLANSATQNVTLTINPALSITTGATLPGGYVGTAYSDNLAAAGGSGSGYTYAITNGAASLTGIGLSMSSSGAITGTPTLGSASFTVKVTDSVSNTATQTFSLTIGPGISIGTAATLPSGFGGAAYSQTLTASGGSGSGYSWSVTSGAASLTGVGLNLSSGGTVSGTAATGSATFTAQVKDSAGNTASQTFTVTINPGVTITTAATLPTGYATVAYAQNLAATGGSGSGYSWSITSGSTSLSAVGLSMSAGGAITGTPTAGTASFTVKVTDSASNAATQTFSLTVNPALSITTGTNLPSGYQGSVYSQTLAATGGSGSGYTWSVTSGGASLTSDGLGLSSGGVVSGTVTSISPASFTVKVTDSVGNTATQNFSLPVAAGITITTGSTLANGFAGAAYSQMLLATGGSASGYTWSVTSGAGSLSAVGLSLSSGGVVSGSAPTVGTATFTAKVTDSASNTASATFTVTINAGLTITSSTTFPNGYAGVSYSQGLSATGGTNSGFSWSVTSGGGSLTTLGLSLSGAGVLSGATPVAGTANFTVKVVDSASNSATQNFSVTISPGITITTASPLPAGYSGVAYSQALAATGGSGTGYSWTVTSGSLSLTASGLSVSAGGVVGGATPEVGTATFTVKVTDSASNTASQTFSVTIGPSLIFTTSSTLPGGYAGTAYSQALAASGGSNTGYTYSITSGGASLTSIGLGMSSGGLISGTPTLGSASFTAKVTDSVGNTFSQAFTLAIAAGISISPGSPLPIGYAGVAYSQALTATGGSGSGYSFAVTSGSASLTAVGLSVSGAGSVSGATPVAGAASFTVKVTDSLGNTASQSYSVTINPAVSISTSATLPTGFAGTNYSTALQATGGSGTGYTWTVTAGAGQLTAIGLSLSGGGVVSGPTPTVGSATFTAKVTDSANNTASQTFTVTIGTGLTITNANPLPAGYGGTSYSTAFTTAGGTGSGQNWTVTAGANQLTAIGLSVSSAGVLSGATPITGSATFTVKVTDSGSNSASSTFSVTINPGLVITSSTPLPAGYVGTPYGQTLTFSGGTQTGLNWSVTSGASQLTAVGLTLSSGGTLSGSTLVQGTATFTVKLTDSASNSTTATLSVTINAGLSITSPATLPSGTLNTNYSQNLTAAGGSGSGYNWTVTAGASQLSAIGLSLSGSGLLSGGSPAVGTANFTAQVTDSASNMASQSFSVSISAGNTVGGNIALNNQCGGPGNQPGITVNLVSGSSPTGTVVMSATTDNFGNFSFANVTNGTYTIVPSVSGAGVSSLFSPTSSTITVSNANSMGNSFQGAVGYTVSGTVTHNPSNSAKTGQVYLELSNSNCTNTVLGTSITQTTLTGGGAFTIRGVAPGSYSLDAWLDNLGTGNLNLVNPSNFLPGETGSTANQLTITNQSQTGVDVTITDPSLNVTSFNGPTIQNVAPTSAGVSIDYKPVVGNTQVNGNNVETVAGYIVQWSTSASSTSFSSSNQITYTANGNSQNVWILNPSVSSFTGTLTSSTAYYFRARGVLSTGDTNWYYYPTAVTVGTPACPASDTCYTVSGTVAIPSTITVNPGAQLYVGMYNQSNGIIYASVVPSPAAGSSYPFTLPPIPSDSNNDYILFYILDQNDDGLIDAYDITNTNNNGNGIPVTSNLPGQSLTLSTINSSAQVQTTYFSSTSSSGSSTGYDLNFDLREGNKLPVAVTLTGGPNVLAPVDLGPCTSCGNEQFQYYVPITSTTPNVGDTYSFLVTYSDSSTDTQTVNGSVTGWNGTSTLVGAADGVTNLEPSGTGVGTPSITQPNIMWTFPANPSQYSYSFYISAQNANTVWQIPGNNSNSNGFEYAQTVNPSGSTTSSAGLITWGTDPTGDSSNTPSPTSLTGGTTYYLQMQVQDSSGNSAQTMTYYIP